MRDTRGPPRSEKEKKPPKGYERSKMLEKRKKKWKNGGCRARRCERRRKKEKKERKRRGHAVRRRIGWACHHPNPQGKKNNTTTPKAGGAPTKEREDDRATHTISGKKNHHPARTAKRPFGDDRYNGYNNMGADHVGSPFWGVHNVSFCCVMFVCILFLDLGERTLVRSGRWGFFRSVRSVHGASVPAERERETKDVRRWCGGYTVSDDTGLINPERIRQCQLYSHTQRDTDSTVGISTEFAARAGRRCHLFSSKSPCQRQWAVLETHDGRHHRLDRMTPRQSPRIKVPGQTSVLVIIFDAEGEKKRSHRRVPKEKERR